MGDNVTHGFHYIDLQQEVADTVYWVRINRTNPTNIGTVYDSPSTSFTDVLVRDRYYTDYCGAPWWTATTGGVIGLYECDALIASNWRCDQASVRISNRYFDVAGTWPRRVWYATNSGIAALRLSA